MSEAYRMLAYSISYFETAALIFDPSDELRMYQDDLYEFEAATRYDSSYWVDETDYIAVQNVLKRFLDILVKNYVPEAAKRIREKNRTISPDMPDLEVVRKYYGELG